MLFYLVFVQNRRYREVPSISGYFGLLHAYSTYICYITRISLFISQYITFLSLYTWSKFPHVLNSIVIEIVILTYSSIFSHIQRVSSLRLVRILLPLRRITRRSAPILLRTVSRVRRVMSTNLSYPIVPPSSYMSEKRVKSSCMPMVKHHSHRVLCSNIPLYISTKAFSEQ